MPLLFQVLASGSKGNAILVSSPRTHILLDVGLTGKELVRRLDRSPTTAKHLDALVLTHEHRDHISGAGVLSRRFELPVYLSRGTLENLPPQIGAFSSVQLFQAGVTFTIGDLQLQAFAISHDAGEPVGFIVEHEGVRLGVCTDIGTVTQLVRTRMQGCHGLILEANHDSKLLLNGPYPWHLKQRIRSRHGHLCNEDTFELLRTLFHEALQSVVFAHLSEVNNHPSLVVESVEGFRRHSDAHDIRFEIGRQDEVAPAIEVT